MRLLFFIFCATVIFSCTNNDNKEKELDLKEKELALKQKELELLEKGMKNDSISISNTTPTTPTITTNLTPEEQVLEIRNEFTRINSLRPTTKRYKFVCDDEGTVDYYWENNKVIKIAIDWGFLGDYSSKSEYYYKNGNLIFTYEVSIGGPAGGKVATTEYRTYVVNDKTIKTMENKKTIPCFICQFSRDSKEYKFIRATNAKEVTAAACDYN